MIACWSCLIAGDRTFWCLEELIFCCNVFQFNLQLVPLNTRSYGLFCTSIKDTTFFNIRWLITPLNLCIRSIFELNSSHLLHYTWEYLRQVFYDSLNIQGSQIFASMHVITCEEVTNSKSSVFFPHVTLSAKMFSCYIVPIAGGND